MAKNKNAIAFIVVAVLAIVVLVGCALPSWGYPEIDFTYSNYGTLKYAMDASGFGALFTTTPTIYLTLVVIIAAVDIILAVVGCVTGKKVLGTVAAVLAFVGAVLTLVGSSTYKPRLAGFWIVFLGLIACGLGWFIASSWKKFWAGVKEFARKFMVMIKRKPQLIPLCAFIVTFLFYSLSLTHISNTTAKIQGSGMGLAGFVTMLLSMLGILCCMNAFPYRKKPNIPMVVLCFVMAAIVFGADIFYSNAVVNFINSSVDAQKVLTETPSIAKAYNNLQTHMVLMAVSAALTALLPVYSKLLRKVKTSVEVEGNEQMGAIDISAE